MHNLKGWKTHALNGLAMLSVILAWEELPTLLDPRYIILGQALANVGMRCLTDGPEAFWPLLRRLANAVMQKGPH